MPDLVSSKNSYGDNVASLFVKFSALLSEYIQFLEFC